MKRVRHSSRIAAGIIGFAATLAMAFFVSGYIGEGTHQGKAGHGGTGHRTLPIHINFPEEALTPTNPVPLEATVDNTYKEDLSFTHLSIKASSSTPGCESSWFKVTAKTGVNATAEQAAYWNAILAGGAASPKLKYPKETSGRPLGDSMEYAGEGYFWLELPENGLDQSSCEGASISVTAKLTE